MKPILKTYSRQKKQCTLDDTEYNFLKEDVLLCCRGCLATDRRLFNIHDHNLADALAHITGTPVFKDKLPQHLCSYCCRLLLKCEAFRDMCLHTQQSLTTDLQNGMLNLDCVRKINRPFNHYIDLNLCEVNTVQYIDLDNPPDCVYLDDLNVYLKDEPETVEGIDSDIKKELETAECTSMIYDDIEDEAATVPDIDGAINYDIDTDGVINDDIGGELDGIINKTDSKADFGTQKRILNISVDKLKPIQNRVMEIGNALKRKKEMVITNVNDERLRAEEQIKRLLTRKRKQTSINDDTPTKLRKVRRRKKADDDMPNFDFAKFETANAVEIVILPREEQLREIEARKASKEYKKAAYTCELCGRYYRTEDAYKNHCEKKHSKKRGPIECPVCKVRFKCKFGYWRHYDKHRFKFVCKQCGFVSRTRNQAMFHYQYREGKKHECRNCPKVFSKFCTYLSHMRIGHKTLNTVCGMCGETFVNVRQHMALVHGVARKKAHMECKTCEVTFVSTHALDKHTMAAGEEHTKMFPCVQCGDTFDSVDSMKIHDDEEHPKCDDCNVKFLNASSFDTHVDRKHRFTKKQKEANKLAKELGLSLPYPAPRPEQSEPRGAVCDHCGKIFKKPSSLVYHLRKLCGKKLKYACPHCPKSYDKRDLYKIHLRVHTGEKPFKCDHCGMTFTSKCNLQRHMLNVHLGISKKYACDICGRVLSTPHSFKLHVRNVHNGEPWLRRVRKKKSKIVSESTD